jgi:aryl-alcohol dehydrogenase-like predicted oxidoreductase
MALGTWGLSGDAYGPVDAREQERVLERAIEMGFSLVETADAYGGGRMEELIGKVLANRRDVVVVTKAGTDRTTSPVRKRFDAPFLRERLEASLRRLRRERVDVYLLHNPSEQALTGSDAVAELTRMKEAGKIGAWGASVGSLDVGHAALAAGAEVLEIAYSLVNGVDLHRLAGEIIVRGAGVLARSTLSYGLLAGTWDRGRDFDAADHRSERWSKAELERRVDQLSALRFLVHGDVRTLRAAAVRFVLANRIVSSAVLGPRSVAQLEELVREVGMGPVYLRDEDLMRIPRALETVGIES